MPLPPPHRPLPVRAINGVGRALRRVGFDLLPYDAEHVIEAAIRKAGSSDFGSDGFREGLAVMIEALDREAALNTIGRLTAQRMLVGNLEHRLSLQAWRNAHPEVAQGVIERPVFIVGLPRTGTTILFNLLAQDPKHRAPLAWEVTLPGPPPDDDTYHTDPRIKEAEKIFENLDRLIPTLPAIHEFGARLPQECAPIQALEFLSIQFNITFRVPTYQAWLETRSMLPAYDLHKRFLQHLQSRTTKARWVLKSPSHLGTIDDLLAVYPDALIIHTHRDPTRVMPSLASLYHAFRGMNSDAVDPRVIGSDVMAVWSKALERAVESRRRHRDKPDQFFDAHFEDVIKDPIDLLRRAYTHFGLDFTPEAHTLMTNFLAANPRGSRGIHRYTREDFGLDLDEIHEAFTPYCREFDVPISKAPA